MIPNSSMQDTPDVTLGNVEHFSESILPVNHRVSNVGFPYFQDIFLGQNMVIGAFAINMSITPSPIFHVVHLRSDIKMFWINTKRIVALMQNRFSFWYRTITENPSSPMRSSAFLIELTYTVTKLMASLSCPVPTLIRFFNVGPKTPLWMPRTLSAKNRFFIFFWPFTILANAVEILLFWCTHIVVSIAQGDKL
jgi:hypothetical protein